MGLHGGIRLNAVYQHWNLMSCADIIVTPVSGAFAARLQLPGGEAPFLFLSTQQAGSRAALGILRPRHNPRP